MPKQITITMSRPVYLSILAGIIFTSVCIYTHNATMFIVGGTWAFCGVLGLCWREMLRNEYNHNTAAN